MCKIIRSLKTAEKVIKLGIEKKKNIRLFKKKKEKKKTLNGV